MNIFERFKVPIGLFCSYVLLAIALVFLLQFMWVIPFGLLLAIGLGNIWLLAGIIWYWNDNTTFNPEGAIFKTARKSGMPVLRLWALNGFHKHVIGSKSKKGDIIFDYDKDHREGIHIDPRIQSGNVPKHFTYGGLEIYDFAIKSPFSMSVKNALAMATVIKHVRKNHPLISVMPDTDIVEYVGRDRNELPHDCANLATTTDFNIPLSEKDIKEYKDEIKQIIEKEIIEAGEELPKDDKEVIKLLTDRIDERWEQEQGNYMIKHRAGVLIREFMQIQDELAILPVEADKFFSFAEAFQNTLSAVLSLDLQTILHLFEVAAEKKHGVELKWIAVIGFAAMLAFLGAGLGWKFAST